MNNSDNKSVSAALRKLMTPVVKMMLRNGVSYRQFTDLCKSLFVSVAADNFGIRGRPTNVSRIALLTGIDRKEIKRLKDQMQDSSQIEQTQQQHNRVTRVLSGWYQDAEFLDPKGQPKILPVSGDQHSFASLAKRFAGDVPASALLKELLRVKVVESLQGDRVKVLRREFIPEQADPAALLRAGVVLHDLGETICHNLYESTGKRPPIFERRASNPYIDPKKMADFQRFVDAEGQAFLERIDDWLTQNEMSEENRQTRQPMRLGVGTFVFREQDEQPSSTAEQQPSGDSE